MLVEFHEKFEEAYTTATLLEIATREMFQNAEYGLPTSDDILLDAIAYTKGMRVSAKNIQDMIEFELKKRLEMRNTNVCQNENWEFLITDEWEYDLDRLKPLLELLDSIDLEKCYKTVTTTKETWDMRSLPAVIKKHGVNSQARQIYQDAWYQGRSRLVHRKRQ